MVMIIVGLRGGYFELTVKKGGLPLIALGTESLPKRP